MIIKRILKAGTPIKIAAAFAIIAIIIFVSVVLTYRVFLPIRIKEKAIVYNEHVGHCTNLIVAEFEIEQGEVERAHQLCRKIYASEHSK